MQQNLWLHLGIVGLGIVGLGIVGLGIVGVFIVIECLIVLIRTKLGLDKDYYLVYYCNDFGENETYRTNDIKIDIQTSIISFRDEKTKKNVHLDKDYSYKEVSKDEWKKTRV